MLCWCGSLILDEGKSELSNPPTKRMETKETNTPVRYFKMFRFVFLLVTTFESITVLHTIRWRFNTFLKV